MSFRQILRASLAVSSLILAGPASAAVIFNNGAPVTTIAGNAMIADPSTSTFSIAADNFSLSSGTTTITDIHWWGIYGTGVVSSDNFTLNIYDNSSSLPGSVVASVNISSLQRTNTGLFVSQQPLYLYDAVVDAINLTAATTYWLGISNNTGGVGGWAWAMSNPFSGSSAQYSTANGSFGARTRELAFNLTNDAAVPEASSIALAAVGLLGCIGASKLRRRAC